MLLDLQGSVVADPWLMVFSAADLGASGDVLLSWELWVAERDALVQRASDGLGRIGVAIDIDTPLHEVLVDLEYFSLVSLEFEKFTDGRFFSRANQLRQQYQFKGELRAVGAIHRDQLAQLRRVGFTSFTLEDDSPRNVIQLPTNAFNLVYQNAADGLGSVRQRRVVSRG